MKMEMEIHEMEFLVSTRNEQFWKLPRETCQIHYLRGGSAVRKERG